MCQRLPITQFTISPCICKNSVAVALPEEKLKKYEWPFSLNAMRSLIDDSTYTNHYIFLL